MSRLVWFILGGVATLVGKAVVDVCRINKKEHFINTEFNLECHSEANKDNELMD